MFSEFFINRPIFTTVISLIIVIAGLVSMVSLPVSQYPTITPVQIQVTTSYPGADAKTLGDSVAAPIEAQINGVENMIYMTSTSSNTGQLTITVYFSLETDPDTAQVLVQNRVNLALPQLPQAVQQFGVSVQKQSSSTLMIIAVYDEAGRYSADYVRTYANVYILDAIKRINGAGQAQIFGVADQAMRIWTNPDRMASLKITTSDIQRSISSQNALFGAGQIGQPPNSSSTQLTFPVVTQHPFTLPSQYENIILRADSKGSAIVRVGDVARAEVGRKQYVDKNFFNGMATTPIAIYQQPGANGLDVSKAVRKAMKEMEKTMPDGIKYVIALDTTDFVRLSIEEVIHTLIEAVILVVLVVYLFLQNFRATVICTVAIFVALIGTFTGLLALGFSINLLTLFGIVLAIGMVVDDAIVVVENVERNMSEFGLSAKEASIKAMKEVSGPVVAVVLVLAAVFIPAAFLAGTTGQLYKQFAITIVISVVISGFVALTLTPAMCGVMLKHTHPSEKGFFGWFNRVFLRMTKAYGRSIVFVIRQMVVAFVCFVLMFVAIVYLFKVIPTSFVPNEDQGYLLAQLIMPDASSLERTVEASNRVDEFFAKNPAVVNRTVVNGYSLIDSQYQSNTATFFVTLKDFKERYASTESAAKENPKAILQGLHAWARDLEVGVLIPIAPPPIPGIGTSSGFEFWIQDMGSGEPSKLYEVTQEFLAKARLEPVLSGLNSTFKASSLQLNADVNRDTAVLLGLPIDDVYNTLQSQFGSVQVSQYEQYSRVWNVILQSDAKFRQEPADITRLYTKSNQGLMIPLSAVVTTSYTKGPSLVPHFNGFPAAQITGSAALGYSSGDAIKAMERVAYESLPQGYKFAWSGMALQEKESGSSSTIAFAFGLLIVFLILAAQYESWSLPMSVLTAVPFGIIGALLATMLRGLENDVYFQIGLLVLVGLAAKNAILIVEFAVGLKAQGKSIIDSAVEAGEMRLRPILMTSLAFIFGVFPLFIAVGAGANARHSIGTGIIGGMIGASSLALIYVPLFFYALEKTLDFFSRSFWNKTAALLAMFLFSGCMVGPNYHPPCFEIPESFQYEIKGSKEDLSLAWWTKFGDPVLEELILEALANNENVKIAAANIENALGILVQTRAPLFPQIGYNGLYSRSRISASTTGFDIPFELPISIRNPQSLWQVVVNASWEIDIWGRTRRLVESARANLFSTVEARQMVILSLVGSVANSYIQLRSLDEQLEISIRTKDSYGKSVDYFEKQFKYGQASQMAVAQAKTQYEIAASTIPQIKALIVQTENAISILLGSNPKKIPRGKGIRDLDFPSVPADIPSNVLFQRPDIRQAEQNLIAANAQIGAAQALYFPSISLTGFSGGASQKLHDLFSGPSRIWNFTGSIAGPIFTAGAISGQVTQAEALQMAALMAYKQAIQSAFAEVEDALSSHTQLIEQLEAQKRLVAAASDYERLATLQYKGGYVPYFAVIQAQEQYFPAELSWVQTRSEYLSSFVDIYQSMGGPWVDIAESKTSILDACN